MKVRPIPEIISGEGFEIRESDPNTGAAYIDLTKRQLVVPFAATDHAEFIRNHESGHLKWTPLDGLFRVDKRVENRTIQAVEDCRINAALRAVGIDTAAEGNADDTSVFQVDEWLARLMAMPPAKAYLESARCLLGLRGRFEYSAARREVEKMYPESAAIADGFYAQVKRYEDRGEVMPFSETLRIALELTLAFSDLPPGEGGAEKGEGEGAPGEGSPTEGEMRTVDFQEMIDPVTPTETSVKLPDVSSNEKDTLRKFGICSGGSRGVRTAAMFEVRAAMKNRHNPKGGIRRRAEDTGAVPRNFHRVAIDNRVFSAKGRGQTKSAAILIDGSGSMSIKTDQLQRVIDVYPASVVALYAGYGSGYGEHLALNERGCLIPLVEYGRYVDLADEKIKRRGSGNMVDLPALKWLSNRREQEKIWICDGSVTGQSDQSLNAESLRDMARVLEGIRGLKRYRGMSEFIEEMERRYGK